MKSFILFWNPAISSYKLDDFQREMEDVSECWHDMNWSVWEHDKAQKGDRFFMVRCGSGKTGICMSGIILQIHIKVKTGLAEDVRHTIWT